MNNEELRRRMEALFAEYGGPIAPFMQVVHIWAKSEDADGTIPIWYGNNDELVPTCGWCKAELVCEACDVDHDQECEECGDDLVCAHCQGYIRKPVEAVA